MCQAVGEFLAFSTSLCETFNMGRTSLAQLHSRQQSNTTRIVVTWNVVEYVTYDNSHATRHPSPSTAGTGAKQQQQLELNPNTWKLCRAACVCLITARSLCRQAAKALLQPSDVVLEVGCCGGMTSSNYNEKNDNCCDCNDPLPTAGCRK
jgi:hypothetical protein